MKKLNKLMLLVIMIGGVNLFGKTTIRCYDSSGKIVECYSYSHKQPDKTYKQPDKQADKKPDKTDLNMDNHNKKPDKTDLNMDNHIRTIRADTAA